MILVGVAGREEAGVLRREEDLDPAGETSKELGVCMDGNGGISSSVRESGEGGAVILW